MQSIPQLKLFMQDITITGYRRGINLIRRLKEDGDQCLVSRFSTQKL